MVRVYHGDNFESFDLTVIETLSVGQIVDKFTEGGVNTKAYLTFMGKHLDRNARFVDLGEELDEYSVFRLICREESPIFQQSSLAHIEEIRNFFKSLQNDRNGQLLHAFTSTMFDPDFLRKQIEAEPELRKDGEVLHILSDYFLLSSYFEESNEAGTDWLKKHPIFVSTLHKLIKNVRAPQGGSLFSMPNLLPPMNPPNPGQQAEPAAPMITQEQLRAAMLQAFGGVNMPNAVPPMQPQVPPTSTAPQVNLRERYASQLVQLHEFGFTEDEQNLQALEAAGGNVEVALDILVTMREGE